MLLVNITLDKQQQFSIALTTTFSTAIHSYIWSMFIYTQQIWLCNLQEALILHRLILIIG